MKKPARKLVGLFLGALESTFHEPGMRPPRIKTGAVEIAPFAQQTDHERFVASVAATLAPPRVESITADVPAKRREQISPFVEERWEPVAVSFDPDEVSVEQMAQHLFAGDLPVAHWRVTQHVTIKQSWTSLSEVERQEVLQSIGQYHRHEDHIYNGYYPTIRGTDVAHHEPGQPGMKAFQGGRALRGRPSFDADGRMTHDGTIRGGTEIRGGRREYREKTKGYEPMGPGWFAHVERIRAGQQAKRDAEHKTKLEKIDALLPRAIGEV